MLPSPPDVADETSVGEMSVRGLLQKVTSLPKRLQPVFYASPLNAAIRAMGLE